ncbi:endonuclease/exonuclease/phosphatase family protein [Trinickia caryophylli]|uniref:Metal-dependent hydrolase, endonuclease/exonuclease/phosphatase family n=1 Tax=Trinickia caryophylli TaxID=28094 RepID=A0A1X7FXH2_TRICW|nr:endonuclease/exonuclease/phosphatase family protein [Trinickia caryophylli]PMS11722.1 endonuclease [Trinickia caryophylli]TRX17401.1 endonuclease [Trinickia caryophylli]WQE11856.1 endonuclease/exonuclease/phosphatase family protein [Trinickia caryophylli]SMF60444.1 Metal-dependent hydrolase, endonuclease/exonuclease/phosphatase family [Trinickia caryophylli]GLU34641.1 endonuclease [Trinickia caryophylli]
MRLLSWNIQWGRDAGGSVDLARTVAEARRLSDFDVLALQEITRGFDTLPGRPSGDQFAELSAALPGFTVLDAVGADLPPPLPGKPRRQFGNALATRLPVRRVIRHSLPWPADAKAPSMPRVALEAEIERAAGALRVIVTHLEYYSEIQRLAQVDELRRVHREAVDHARHPAPAEPSAGPFAASDRPPSAIVCGDFNCDFGSPAYQRFVEPIDDAPSFIEAWTALHPGCKRPPTAGVYDQAQWSEGPLSCDFVFVTDNLRDRLVRCEIDPHTQASDHQPILIELD